MLPYALSKDKADTVFAIASLPSSSAASRGSCLVADVGVTGGELTARSDFAKFGEHSGQPRLPSVGDLKRHAQEVGLAHAVDHSMGSKDIFTGCGMFSDPSWCRMGMLFVEWLFLILPVLRCGLGQSSASRAMCCNGP